MFGLWEMVNCMLCFWLKDKEQGKNIVVVGSWNTEDHMNWAKKNVARSYHLKDDGVQKVKYDYIYLTYILPLKSLWYVFIF